VDLVQPFLLKTTSVLPGTFVKRDIVVVGASAGGVQALQLLVRGLPKDFQGTVLVVLHIPAWAPSELAQILSLSGPLPAIQAGPHQQLEPGHIYVAAPDFHLIVEDHQVVRWKGPAEDRHRPSINTLFRSAAVTYGERVVSAYGGLREYSCLVGHRYSARGLLQAHSEAQEKSLWAAVVALEEAGNLVREVAGDFPDDVAERLQEQAAKKKDQAAAIRRILQQLKQRLDSQSGGQPVLKFFRPIMPIIGRLRCAILPPCRSPSLPTVRSF
jgi:two-component system chemotaxis response regulator CheB